jgi:RNA polymerase sigma-70 factor (ECF subfamily)
MQADLTMGNLASALTLPIRRGGSDRGTSGRLRGSLCVADRALPPTDLLAAGAHRAGSRRRRRPDPGSLREGLPGVGSFHGESSLRTWIYRIALREASNQRRWWMRHKQQEIPIEQEMGESEAGSRCC